jgi:lipid A 4'-phosphatase
MMTKKAFKWQILWPILAMLAFTPWSGQLDKTVADFFYRNGSFMSDKLTQISYHYGFLPAWMAAGVAFLILCGSYFLPSLKRWRQAATYLLLTLAVGPGLIIHAGLKDHWGRPRPKQVVEYGGKQHFRPYYQPNFFHQSEPSKSFPCGHCSMGFYFFTLALLGKHYRKKKLRTLGMIIALGLGTLLSFSRVAQGGHFLSDTLMSALIMWLTSLAMYQLSFKSYPIPITGI